jgi:hypothetical protein
VSAPNYNPDILTCIANLSSDEVFTPPQVANRMLDMLPADRFAQHASDYSAAFTGRYTDEADIALMAKLGFDNVRLSIDPVPLEQSMNH